MTYTLIPPPSWVRDWTTNRTDQWLKIPEIKALVGKRMNYLEVGVFEGRTFVWVLENIATHPEARAHCIDLFKDNPGFPDHVPNYYPLFRHHVEPYKNKVYIRRGYTHEELELFPVDEFDLIYIDASHDQPSVERDGRLAFPLLKKGGVMVFDDYGSGECMPGVNAFCQSVEGRFEVLESGYQLFIQRTK